MEVGKTYRGRIRNICVDDKINKATFGNGVLVSMCVRVEERKTHVGSYFSRPLQRVFLCATNDL